jgi:serine/threonine protein kinase
MEYCNGGTLSECLRKYQNINGRPFPEDIVQYLMRQIINALTYIHNRNIIHRDLKLDNILVNFSSDFDKNNLNMMKAVIKIIDFGFATHMDYNVCFSTLGSPINMDPNILKKLTDNKKGINTGQMVGYDQKADIWSIGTLCYEMLIGKSAFNSKSMEELVRKVESGSYNIPTNLSKEVVSFLNAMLQYNPQKRLSSNELARHQFLTKNVNTFERIPLRKVTNKVKNNNLNINIKRNSTIWSIFNEEDENKLINIHGDYLSPINEQVEFNLDNINNINNIGTNDFYQDYNNQNNVGYNDEVYQGYGAGINGIDTYDNTNSQKGYGTQDILNPSPNYQNDIQMFNSPIKQPFEQIGQNQMFQNGPILEIPSFGVPSPGEKANVETGYGYSSGGIFRNNYSQDCGYNSNGGGYGYGYGY